jgi:trk system potassium uptake protein TrkH
VPVLVGGFLLFTALAVLAFHVPGIGVTGQELSLRRTVFAAVNATTLTGFQQDVGSSLPGADVLRLVLTLGGTMFALTAGGILVVRAARMSYTNGQVAWAAAAATVAATVSGAAFLLEMPDRGLVPSLLQSASAFGNSGLYAGRLPGVLDWRTHAVLMPLAFAGALGIPVVMELFDRLTGARRLSPHTRTVLVLAASFYIVGALAIALLDRAQATPNPAGWTDWRVAAATGSVFALNARTAGLPFEFAAALARPAQWVLVVLMIVGGSPGGTAGGLKTTTVWRLFGGVRDSLAGRYVTRSFGVAACWAALYFTIALAGFLLLLASEPDLPADRLLFLAFSAASNVGLSHDAVSITGNGLYTLSGMMLAGRLAPLLVLGWLASSAGHDVEDAPVAVG